MSDYFDELFGYGQAKTLNFFFVHLKDVTDDDKPSPQELLYAASVLAHFAQASCNTANPGSLPTAAGLSEVFERYVGNELAPQDPDSLEYAGSEILLLSGFFRDQLKRRHNVEWFEAIGRTFYARAGQLGKARKRAVLLTVMAEHYPYWTGTFGKLSRELRDKPYVIRG